jgi:ferric-dicitrate binding protein FerR (iron transport regulator)
VQRDIRKRNRQKHIRIYLAAASAAACIALLAVLLHPFFSVQDDKVSPENLFVAADSSAVNRKDIRLVLANNETITFENDADIKYDREGGFIVNTGEEQIRTSKAVADAIALNTLIVPKGKRSSLTLADGTKVWINSGSTLKFPAQFNTSKREIWVEGEIYIEVEKDEAHPFHVNTSQMVIGVTGTRFNVTAYHEDAEHSVVLVEGSVDVCVKDEKTHLSPSQMLSATGDSISVKEVNIYDYISWKEGYLHFTCEPLANILKRLSRYYDIPIGCEEDIAALECNGKLVLFDNKEEVLKTICNTIPVKYSMEEDRILVQKR